LFTITPRAGRFSDQPDPNGHLPSEYPFSSRQVWLHQSVCGYPILPGTLRTRPCARNASPPVTWHVQPFCRCWCLESTNRILQTQRERAFISRHLAVPMTVLVDRTFLRFGGAGFSCVRRNRAPTTTERPHAIESLEQALQEGYRLADAPSRERKRSVAFDWKDWRRGTPAHLR